MKVSSGERHIGGSGKGLYGALAQEKAAEVGRLAAEAARMLGCQDGLKAADARRTTVDRGERLTGVTLGAAALKRGNTTAWLVNQECWCPGDETTVVRASIIAQGVRRRR